MKPTQKGHLTNEGPLLLPRKKGEAVSRKQAKVNAWTRMKKQTPVTLDWGKK